MEYIYVLAKGLMFVAFGLILSTARNWYKNRNG